MSGDEGECVQLLVIEMLYEICASRWSFNITLGMTGVFAVAAGGSPNSTTLCSLAAAWSLEWVETCLLTRPSFWVYIG